MGFVKRSEGAIVAVVDGDEIEMREEAGNINLQSVECVCGTRKVFTSGVIVCECGAILSAPN